MNEVNNDKLAKLVESLHADGLIDSEMQINYAEAIWKASYNDVYDEYFFQLLGYMFS